MSFNSHTFAQAGAKNDQGDGNESAWPDKGQEGCKGDWGLFIIFVVLFIFVITVVIIVIDVIFIDKVTYKKIEDFSENEITSAFQTQCTQLSEWQGKQTY